MERTTLATVLQVLTLAISLVGAIGVLIINSKVDRLTGQVQTLQELLVTHVTTPGVHSSGPVIICGLTPSRKAGLRNPDRLVVRS